MRSSTRFVDGNQNFQQGGVFGVGRPNGHVSEMSVQYNTYLDKYVTMYSEAAAKW